MRNKKIPVYATGKNVREWLYVEDCAEGILRIMDKGRIGETYNLGSRQEKRNIATVRLLLNILKRIRDLIEFIKDRPGHDLRYSLDSGKVFKEIGWRPRLKFEDGLRFTAQGYLKNKTWLSGK